MTLSVQKSPCVVCLLLPSVPIAIVIHIFVIEVYISSVNKHVIIFQTVQKLLTLRLNIRGSR